MKVPCIKINNKDWNYIKPILEGFGYETGLVDMTIESPLDYLIINCNGKIGNCNNLSDRVLTDHDRYLVKDKEEFLRKAAELIGKTYKKKEFTLKDIKPSMIVELRNHDRMLAILVEGKLRFIDQEGAFNIYHDENFSELEGLTDLDIIKVFEPAIGSTLLSLFEDPYLKLVWERPKKKRVVSKQAIKKAFNIKPDEELEIVE